MNPISNKDKGFLDMDTLILIIGSLKYHPIVNKIRQCIRFNSGDNRIFLFWEIIEKYFGLPVNFYFLETFFRTIGIDAYFTVVKRVFPNSKIVSIYGQSEYDTIVNLGYGKQPFETDEKYYENFEYLKISGVLAMNY